jgi:hypothetical protein
MFATVEPGLLPAVEAQRWDTRRHVPVPADHPDLPQTRSDREYVLAVSYYVSMLFGREELDKLYDGVHPTLRMDGARLLEDMPAGTLPVKDFVLDLGRFYGTVMRSVKPEQLALAATGASGGAV